MQPGPRSTAASHSLRQRLALTALLVAWVLAGVFFFLGLRASANTDTAVDPSVEVAGPPSPPMASPGQS